MIESYMSWVGRQDDTYSLIFNKYLFYKHKMANLIPAIMEQLRYPITGSSGAYSSHGGSISEAGVVFFRAAAPLHRIGAGTKVKNLFIPNNLHPLSNASSVVVFTPTKYTKGLSFDWLQMNMASGLTKHLETKSFASCCQGFIQLFSGSDPKGFRPKTLTETPSSFLASDYLGPILGSSNW
jgi:hypothetical protein